MVDISSEHIRTIDFQSSLSYVARTDLDYGTLLCWGNNSLGVQADPCIFKVIPAELPQPPTNCSVINDEDILGDALWDMQEGHDSQRRLFKREEPKQMKQNVQDNVLVIKCDPNNNVELPLKFTALIYDANSQKLLANVSNSSISEFYVRGLKHISDLDILIHSVNSRGVSNTVTVRTRTSVDIAEKRTAQVRHNPSQSPVPETQTFDPDEQMVSSKNGKDEMLVPILAVVLGVLGSLGLIAVVAVLLLFLKKSSRATQVMTMPCSLAESPDSSPDVIPAYGQLLLSLFVLKNCKFEFTSIIGCHLAMSYFKIYILFSYRRE